jgi:broad specificity phosphatase PhoE
LIRSASEPELPTGHRLVFRRENYPVTSVLFIRHAKPIASDGIPAARWPLSDEGTSGAKVLGLRLADDADTSIVWTSPEHKARETAALVFPSAVTHVKEQLSEVSRPWYSDSDDLAGAVKRYLSGDAVEGWEDCDVVIERLASLEAEFAAWERPVVVGHGVLLTTWLDHLLGLEDPFLFWLNLRMPDAWVLGLEARSLERIA